MSISTTPPITAGNEEYAEPLSRVIGAAFAGDALNRAIILLDDTLPNDAEISTERRVAYFLPGMQSKAAAGALLVEAGNWAAVALWVPPGVKSPPLDRSTTSPLTLEYHDKFAELKRQRLGDRQYWYLDFIGRDPDRNEPGAIRALFEPYLRQAKESGFPVWLEATNEHARDVYTHFGFELVAAVPIGKGIADRSGNLAQDGEGVTIYVMVAEP